MFPKILLIQGKVMVSRYDKLELRLDLGEHVERMLILLELASKGQVATVQEHIGFGQRLPESMCSIIGREQAESMGIRDDQDTSLDSFWCRHDQARKIKADARSL